MPIQTQIGGKAEDDDGRPDHVDQQRVRPDTGSAGGGEYYAAQDRQRIFSPEPAELIADMSIFSVG